MARKQYSADQIISHLSPAEILISQGKSFGGVFRQLGMSELGLPSPADSILE
jgi:hypothetical protein